MRRNPRFWWVGFTDHTIRLYDEDRHVTKEEWFRNAPAEEAAALQLELKRHPERAIEDPET
jgi:hypothetical protein